MRDEWILKINIIGSNYAVPTLKFTRLTADQHPPYDYRPITGVDVTVKRITIDNRKI